MTSPTTHHLVDGPVAAAGSDVATRPDLDRPARLAGCTAVLFGGAIFGFFYAWVCSTMWGLDDVDPRVAIEAMQAMNASVRNPVFFPAFFLTPAVMAVAGVVMRAADRRRAAIWFFAAAVVYLVGGLALTATINVPMNEDLADVVVPSSTAEAEQIWSDYSGRWQFWNLVRTIASGIAFVFSAVGLRLSSRPR